MTAKAENMTTTLPQIKVGLVEDQADTLQRMVAVIGSSQSMQVQFSAASVREATAALSKFSPDVLLVDLGLPDGSGLEVIALASRDHPECEVMVFSMFGDEERVLASIEAGATGYVLKDTPGLALDDAIRQVYCGGAPMSPGIARQVLRRLRGKRTDVESVEVAAGKTLREDDVPSLTAREAEILDLLSRGYTYSEVARLLSLTVHTIQSHVKHLYSKLSVHSRAEAVFEASKIGLLPGLSRE